MNDDNLNNSLTRVPLRALIPETIKKLSEVLDVEKIFPSDEGYPRDYRGLADLLGINNNQIYSSKTPTAFVISLALSENKNIMLSEFVTFFQRMDRWDVIDDYLELIVKDAELYNNSYAVQVKPSSYDLLTLDGQTHYDGVLLFADEDEYFALAIRTNLRRYHLNICTKDDLLAGSSEMRAMKKIIHERCNKVIVVMSPAYLKKQYQDYFDYAQYLTAQKEDKRLIICIERRFDGLEEINGHVIIDFSRQIFYNFWEKLYKSIIHSNENFDQRMKALGHQPLQELEWKNTNDNCPDPSTSLQITNGEVYDIKTEQIVTVPEEICSGSQKQNVIENITKRISSKLTMPHFFKKSDKKVTLPESTSGEKINNREEEYHNDIIIVSEDLTSRENKKTKIPKFGKKSKSKKKAEMIAA